MIFKNLFDHQLLKNLNLNLLSKSHWKNNGSRFVVFRRIQICSRKNITKILK